MTATQPDQTLHDDRNMTRRQTHTTSHDHRSGKETQSTSRFILSKPAVILLFISIGWNCKNSSELGSNSAQNRRTQEREQNPPDELDTFGSWKLEKCNRPQNRIDDFIKVCPNAQKDLTYRHTLTHLKAHFIMRTIAIREPHKCHPPLSSWAFSQHQHAYVS